ncbi:hypothetical protein [Mycolicibacterium gadium]|uniref:hypothetical protein n=1 Tax=Mycolicibacterium gadium TaxID=1794 RepID=UPI0013D1B9F2|nr:hypothetical protein [Mycolicibacterium gadium]
MVVKHRGKQCLGEIVWGGQSGRGGMDAAGEAGLPIGFAHGSTPLMTMLGDPVNLRRAASAVVAITVVMTGAWDKSSLLSVTAINASASVAYGQSGITSSSI